MFEHFKALDIDPEKTVEFTMGVIPGRPILSILPATALNGPYYNEILREAIKAKEAVEAEELPEEAVDLMAANRGSDRKLYPLYIIRGWRSVKDGEGNDIPFSPDACKEFCTSLPDWIFDELRNYAATPGNFMKGAPSPTAEARTTKNS